MESRFRMEHTLPSVYKKMMELDAAVAGTGIDPALLELIKIYASQLNGCAFCVDMHTRDARESGEQERRIYHLSVWRESPLFTPAERAALEMTEALTLVAGRHIPDTLRKDVIRHFGAEGAAQIMMAIVTINAWNRIAIGTGKRPEA
ncbi:carboxymuconolactone decarboxylase family protein [Paenibacillus sambharensis]|uniref:Carboxymuconolactone decarboxylase family protein n=1 Tax=Paenibacillus sambharensis TaxID=1803190 RepID=A0A2W1LFP8_9BACL|nr:carboxymuconolactone decarboxylase family protein [Paenibacillus sambharensis]PZD96870.1 carboxymuconolactone decarboxylase family protein [Paenibacillus sambharensis]